MPNCWPIKSAAARAVLLSFMTASSTSNTLSDKSMKSSCGSTWNVTELMPVLNGLILTKHLEDMLRSVRGTLKMFRWGFQTPAESACGIMSVIFDVSFVYSWVISQRSVTIDNRLDWIVQAGTCLLYTLCWDPVVESGYVSHVSRWDSFSKGIVEFPPCCSVQELRHD